MPAVPAAYSEEVITIIPCSSNHNNAKFFDMPSYFLQKGQQIRWYNAGDGSHRIVITESGGKGILSNSGIIKPSGSFQYRFDNDGIYNFSSAIYPWMQGNVSVNLLTVPLMETVEVMEIEFSVMYWRYDVQFVAYRWQILVYAEIKMASTWVRILYVGSLYLA